MAAQQQATPDPLAPRYRSVCLMLTFELVCVCCTSSNASCYCEQDGLSLRHLQLLLLSRAQRRSFG